jgi:hypothetical protein
MAYCFPGGESYNFEAEHVIVVGELVSKAKSTKREGMITNVREKEI